MASMSPAMRSFVEALGWLGVVCILGAFALLNFSNATKDSYNYLFLNLFGALALIIHSSLKKDYELIVLNSIWAIVAILGIIKIL